ncbi:MAG: rRNA ((1402)-N(4))-methyltransferase RsmH [Candidatus Parcubacteria bacterium]
MKEGDVFVDATLGRGGHSGYVAERYNNTVSIVGIDADPESIRASEERLKTAKTSFKAIKGNFREIENLLQGVNVPHPDKILFDLGWNTNQFEEGGRGFSFQKDEPLLMSYSDTPSFTAGDIINTWEEESIANVLFGYGEERYARRIARHIVEKRKIKPIETAKELADIIAESVPFFYRRGKINPATKSFQALRIAVNDELKSLGEALEGSARILSKGGRIAVITFHSIEDRIVKNFFKELQQGGEWILINKKPLTPSREELIQNPRARSAKLRIIEKK